MCTRDQDPSPLHPEKERMSERPEEGWVGGMGEWRGDNKFCDAVVLIFCFVFFTSSSSFRSPLTDPFHVVHVEVARAKHLKKLQ